MEKDRRKSQLTEKQKNVLFYLSLFLFAMLSFLFLGESGYFMSDDSESYIIFPGGMEGVMPIYPFFLYVNRLLFGENRYLYAVVVMQSLFAAICVILFIKMIRNHFQLRYIETYVCFFLALFPFTANMPDRMVTHEILTEGIAYAAFYLFFAALLQTVWKKSWKWFGILCMTTLLLSSIRSQLQILFGVCGAALIYIIMLGKSKGTRKKFLFRFLIAVVGCLATWLIGIWAVSHVASGYQRAGFIQRERLRQEKEQELAETGNNVQEQVETEKSEEKSEKIATTSQYVSLIFAKGMYEADYEDYLLFDDERFQGLYLCLYDRIDREQYRYCYADSGLWMWKDIAGSADIPRVCWEEQGKYLTENPELRAGFQYVEYSNNSWTAMGVTLVKAHFGRFLYHSLMLLPQAFVSTVFFQIEEIYLLCHLITLFLYVSAIILVIWAYRDKKIKNDYGEFMLSVLCTNIILVVIISIVFIGQKRYVFYSFGVFYIAYFLLLLQVWKQYGKDIAKRIIERFRKSR